MWTLAWSKKKFKLNKYNINQFLGPKELNQKPIQDFLALCEWSAISTACQVQNTPEIKHHTSEKHPRRSPFTRSHLYIHSNGWYFKPKPLLFMGFGTLTALSPYGEKPAKSSIPDQPCSAPAQPQQRDIIRLEITESYRELKSPMDCVAINVLQKPVDVSP